jgi:hypothetical protein
MQHPAYGTFGKLYRNPFTSYFGKHLLTNIKTLYTYPKIIFYSARYNAGEKFILDNTEIYPHKYDFNLNQEQVNEPLRLSTKLFTSTREYQILDKINIKDYLGGHKKVHESLTGTFSHLYYINQLNENIDLPVVVYSRILYAHVLIEKKKFHLTVEVKQNVLDKILSRFLEKIEYADAESIANVAYYLAHTGHKSSATWGILLNNISTKSFYPEFTKVINKNPFIFRYEEIKEKSNSNFDKISEALYLNGYRPVVDLYSSLKKLDLGHDIQKDLDTRFPDLKKYLENDLRI